MHILPAGFTYLYKRVDNGNKYLQEKLLREKQDKANKGRKNWDAENSILYKEVGRFAGNDEWDRNTQILSSCFVLI